MKTKTSWELCKISRHTVIARIVDSIGAFGMPFKHENGGEWYMLSVKIIDSPDIEKGTVTNLVFKKEDFSVL